MPASPSSASRSRPRSCSRCCGCRGDGSADPQRGTILVFQDAIVTATDETLERIARSGEAGFATDCADRIVLWNKKCETLLGKPARSVLGRRCDEVLSGRDVFGNLYCHRNCPIAFQAREGKTPVNRFTLSIQTSRGQSADVHVSMF